MIRLGIVKFFDTLREARGLAGKPDANRAAFADMVAEMLGGVAGLTVVDVGCGSADIGYFLSRLGARYTGIDSRRVGKAEASIEVEYADACLVADRPERRSQFDVCLLVDVVGYDRNLDRALLAACRKLLRDSGQLYLDWPEQPEHPAGTWIDEDANFSFRLRWQYDMTSRMQRVRPKLHYRNAVYTISEEDAPTYPLSRYLYSVGEMRELLTSVGFQPTAAPQSDDPSYVRLVAKTARV
ncbi:class I SAM-dependent methyltransferase [uncultured Bradyrhizobium sp.]|uniref:class I SAM-dependent methyltransferase n=1 Tax=uncultured Bradyrhizobium sp. TaxID=199684 RepID=UPI0035CA7990